MYDWWIAVIIGIVEGLTEFLPVSSTGHMILAGHALGFTGDQAETFEVVIQLGAILAVVVIYWRRLITLFTMLDPRKSVSKPRMNLLHIVIAITPALLLAYGLRDFIKDVLFSPQTVVIGLILGGIFMIAAEKSSSQPVAQHVDEISYKQALMIGLAQCLSVWPGFSRSGATIAGGMMAGANRAAAADFTFIIAIPVMIAAAGYELLTGAGIGTSRDLLFLLTGFVVSFLVALLAVLTFIRLVQKLSLTYFAYYRFALAGVVILLMSRLASA